MVFWLGFAPLAFGSDKNLYHKAVVYNSAWQGRQTVFVSTCCPNYKPSDTDVFYTWMINIFPKDYDLVVRLRHILFPASLKGKFLYSAVSSPQDRSICFTLYFPDRPVHSDTISASLGSIQQYAAINARRLLVHISTTVYSQVLI